MNNKIKYTLLSLCCILIAPGLQAGDTIRQSVNEQYLPVAFGEQKKANQTISSYTISGEELLKSRSTNLMIALQGKIPGLNILQTSGEPGSEGFAVQIRGFNSGVNNNVLFLIDGIERNPYGVDLNEVASVTVLKDAAATAMYGMRGAGGVVLINTHRGINGKSEISVTVDHAFQTPTSLPNFVSAYDYANMYNQRVANDNTGTPYTEDEIEHYRTGDMQAYYPTRNMLDDFIKSNSQLTRANVSIKGGSNMMRFFTSIGIQEQGGMFENVPFDEYSYDAEKKSERFNFRTNLDMKVNNTLDAWVYIGGFLENGNGPNASTSDILTKLYETPNNAFNDLTPDGEVVANDDRLETLPKESVFGMLNRTGSALNTETRIGNIVGARQDLSVITKGLSATAQASFDVFSRKIQTRSRSYESYKLVPVNSDSMTYAAINNTKNSGLDDGLSKFFYYMYNFRGTINYQRDFEDHSVSAIFLGESQMEQQQALLTTHFLALGGRANYAYKNKYLAEVNMSYQGSEQFAKGKRFGFFPSLSLGWVATEEKFLENSDVVNFLKVRASIGQNGNSVYNYGNSNQYLYLTTWNSNATENQIGNEDISWEISTRTNVGIDAEFFNALSLGLDLFYNKNDQLIVTDLSSIPAGMSGLNVSTLPPANIGYGINKGFDLSLAYAKEFSSGLSVLLSGNLSGNKNRIDYIGELPYTITGTDRYAYEYRAEGYSLGQTWGYVSDGLFNDQADVDAWVDQSSLTSDGITAPGDIRYKDLTGDGIVDDKDLAPLEVLNRPTFFYGFNTQLAYKGVDLNISFVGVADRYVRLNGIGHNSNNDNFTEYMKKAWTPENSTSDEYPRLSKLKSNTHYSDFWVKNGAFLRLKNVELGYTIPKTIASGQWRFYVNALNPLVWHHLPSDDFDPEAVNGSSTNYPIMKALNFGINVKF